MEAGRLRHRIDIEQAVETKDSNGDASVTWTPIGTVWGAVEPIRGREATFGNQTLAEMDTRITVRYSPMIATLTAMHRMVHQGTYFNIVSIANVRLGQREVEILAKQGINDG